MTGRERSTRVSSSAAGERGSVETGFHVSRSRLRTMDRRHFLTVAATAPLAGCTELFGREAGGRLDLTVQNEPNRLPYR